MAHRKRSRKRHSRRRVSGIGSNESLMMLLGGVGGYLAGNALANQLTTVDEKIKAGALIALPVVFSKTFNSALLKGAAVGIGIAGAKAAGKAFNIAILSGTPVVSGTYRRRVNGYYNLPVIQGSADQPYLRTGATQNVVSGIPSDQIYAGGMMEKGDYNDESR